MQNAHDLATSPSPAKPTRRRDAAQTKARILAAAVEIFSASGYARTGLRDIAARAGVASSLLVRHFGTKPALFEAALLDTIRANSVFSWDKQDFGETMVRLIRSKSSNAITTMLVHGLSDPQAHDIAARVWREQIIAPLAQWLGEPDATGRAQNLYALMAGFTLLPRAMGDEPASAAALAWQASAMQAIVDGSGLP